MRLIILIASFCPILLAAQSSNLRLLDVFQLAWVSEPTISPNGEIIAYIRNGYDITTDRSTSDLWIFDVEKGTHLPALNNSQSIRNLAWNPKSDRLAFTSNADGGSELFIYYPATRSSYRITRVEGGVRNSSWSPDGSQLAFNSPVGFSPGSSVVQLPPKPDNAAWNDAPRYVDRMQFREDGGAFIQPNHQQVFVVSSEGRAARQVTYADYDVTVSDWIIDGKGPAKLLVTANPNNEDEADPANTDIGKLDLSTGEISFFAVTTGPESSPKASPDGKSIAYLSNVDTRRGYENSELFILKEGQSKAISLSAKLDRSIDDFQWHKDGLIVQYDDFGDTRLAKVSSTGIIENIVERVGGLSLGRPYSGGSFSVSENGRIAYTLVGSQHPSDLGFFQEGKVTRLTNLNEFLFKARTLAEVEEIKVRSSADDEEIQAWIVRPADFSSAKKYPLLLEIHGGPYTNYGNRFSMENQLYAAAGYVVVYVNPRGSTSYGERFANLIEDNYPGEDYDDLISVVDAVIKQGSIDTSHLYVTGGSGGGVLTAWIVGKTNRFRAAVVAKPVINWTSFSLYADMSPFFSRYWFAKAPWEDQASYWKRSPLSLVGNVETPTMLLTGESDYRTPIGESEQYFTALKLRGIETAMVRIPGAGHGITARPSNLMAKVSGVLGWFERYDGQPIKPLLAQ